MIDQLENDRTHQEQGYPRFQQKRSSKVHGQHAGVGQATPCHGRARWEDAGTHLAGCSTSVRVLRTT
eukprot:6466682-Amphidinium_carterae.1